MTVAARPQDRALPLAAVLRGRAFTGTPGKYVTREDTVRGFKEILDGKYDHLPEPAFMYKGGIDEVVSAAQGQ